MRIAIDLTSLSDNFTGIERYALNIAKELIKLDTERRHTYILLFKRELYPAFKEYRHLKNIIFHVYQGEHKLLFAQVLLPLHLYRIKADIFLFLAFQSPLLFWHSGIYNTVHDLTCWDCPETMVKKMDEFPEQIEQTYRHNIIVTGFIEDVDLPYVYYMADCFIFPSLYEGFGMPPLEAMAVGTLVVSSDATALPEVLGKAASYFRLGDQEGLKEKMGQIH